jgi:hypothetical protein
MKITELTAAQERRLVGIRDEWVAVGLATGPSEATRRLGRERSSEGNSWSGNYPRRSNH